MVLQENNCANNLTITQVNVIRIFAHVFHYKGQKHENLVFSRILIS